MHEPSSAELQVLAQMRLDDAKALHEIQRTSAAYYLAGYAVECALKAIIAQSFRQGVIPSRVLVNDLYTHDLTKLVRLAGLEKARNERDKESADFRANWAVVGGWSESSRYEIIDPFYSAAMIRAVGNTNEGILPWLKTHW